MNATSPVDSGPAATASSSGPPARIHDGPIPTATPPGLLGWLNPLREEPLPTLLAISRRFGDVVRMPIAHISYHLFTSPSAVRRVLQERPRNYTRTKTYRKMGIFIGQGLLLSEGDFWLRQRRIAQPAFHKERLAALSGEMVSGARETAARLSAAAARGAVVDVADELQRMTLRIAATTMFGHALDEEDVERVAATVSFMQFETDRRVQMLFEAPLWLPTPANRRVRAANAVLDELVYRMIGERRRGGDAGTRHDLLSLLLDARDADTGEGMSDRQLRDEMVTLLLAGHETTANALAWTMWELVRNPEIAERLRRELDAVLGDRDPTLADVPRLGAVTRVLEETMRLHPPAWAFERHALEDDVIDGWHLPAGSDLLLSPYVMHRDPRLWPEPERFDPERFTPEQSAARPRYAYMPFGGGPRLCIGREFALLEMQLVLPVLLRAARYARSRPDQTVEELPQITLRPDGGVPLSLRAVL